MEFFSNLITEITLLFFSFLFAKIFPNGFRYEFQRKIRKITNGIIVQEIIQRYYV
jgi:hypothetical protein